MLPSAEFAAFCCENPAALTGFAWGRLVVVSQEEISRSPPQPCSHGKGHHGARGGSSGAAVGTSAATHWVSPTPSTQ